jgi:YD repeat-containing protein
MRRFLLLLAAVSLCSAPLAAQLLAAEPLRGPDLEKGISPEKTYDFGGLDAINLFNGSLTLPIPLGPSYSVGPLSYRFTLIFTGNNWDLESNTWFTADPEHPGAWIEMSLDHYVPFAAARTAGEFSLDVGLGWQLTLGRESTGLTVGTSEPGHGYWDTLYDPDTTGAADQNPSVSYTNDGSFRRRRAGVPCNPVASSTDGPCYEIDFPDGSVHQYDKWGRLLEMRGPVPANSTGAHPYAVTIKREIDGVTNAPKLTVTDSYGRKHTFITQRMASVGSILVDPPPSPQSNLGGFNQPDHYDVVTEAKLAAFDLPGGATREEEVATYFFSYADGNTANSGLDATPISRRTSPQQDCAVPVQALVPLLERLTQPDQLSFAMTYDRGDGVNWSRAEPMNSLQTCGAEVQGYSSNLTSLTLPTKGRLAWTYRLWEFPRGYNGARCPGAVDAEGNQDTRRCGGLKMDSVGVATRTALEVDGTLLSKRTYSSAFYSVPDKPHSSHTQITTVEEHAKDAAGVWAPAVTTLSYFSVGTQLGAGQIGVIPEEYGLPFTRFADVDPVETRRVPFTDPNGPGSGPGRRFLTSKTVDKTGALKRYSYIAYEADQAIAGLTSNRRVRGESTYDVDTNKYVSTDRGGYDGLGHYRTTTSRSDIPSTPDKTTFVDYDGITGLGGTFATRYDPPSPLPVWVTSPYKSTTIWQGVEGSPAIHAEYCFGKPSNQSLDRHLLSRQRLRRSLAGTQSDTDVVIVYEYDTRGNVISEKYFGGDLRDGEPGGVGSGALCSLTSLGTLDYQVNYTHVDPPTTWSVTSAHTGMTFKNTDVTVDPNTGLVAQSRDSAGLVTDYTYDRMGRLTRISPTGRAAAVYTYPKPSDMTLTVKREGSGTEPLPHSVYTFDGLGRLITETESMPAGTVTGNVSSRTTTYDSLGRRASVSELGNASAKTEFQYDVFGRITKTTLPDNSVTEWTYQGNWKTTRKNTIWTGTNTEVLTGEEYDGHGRLVAVVEGSGPTSAANKIGANVRTEYTYGPGDQLLTVKMTGSGTSQFRSFDYDGRGFLRRESQPEAGTTTYRYDARGHVLTKRGESPSQFDLDYEYDSAERLLNIKGRDPWTEVPASLPLKEFMYGTANGSTDLRRGKLTLARRYNYDPSAEPYVITDTYQYNDAPGRRTHRTTTIAEQRSSETTVLKTITTSMSYTELDLPAITTYPMAVGAGIPGETAAATGQIDRSGMTRAYDRGRLTSIHGFTMPGQKITYSSNGMRRDFPHANGVIDTQKAGLMARPEEIGFATYDRCIAPRFETQPANDTSNPQDTVQLQAMVSGVRPLHYQWWSDNGPAGNGSITTGTGVTPISLPVSPDVTTSYQLVVENECGAVESEWVTITVNGPCTPPEIEKIEPVRQLDGSFILTPTFTAAEEGRTFEWTKGTSTAALGTDQTYHVTGLADTTTFHLTISDDCGFATKSVEIVILKQMPAAGLVATLNAAQTQVSLTWPSVTGAVSYVIERRSGSGWAPIEAQAPSNAFVDTAVQAGRTYAYRVQASNRTGYTDADLATTGTFTNAMTGQVVSAAVATSTLNALNSVRTAAGLATLTWQTLLPSTEPAATAGKLITQQQMLALRSRINDVRQILGAPPHIWTDPDLNGGKVKAVHWQELLLGAQ